MNDNVKNMIDDKDDFLLDKALIEFAELEGLDLTNKKIVTIDETSKYEISVEDAKREIKNILKYKEELFNDVDLEDITPEEYEEILKKYHNAIKIEISPDDENTIKNKYPNINFNNIRRESTKFIISGDTIYPTIEQCFGNDGDYSPVIMQWCRAVELELRDKIYSYLDNKECKNDITEVSQKTSYFVNNKNRRRDFKPLYVNDMMGFYDALYKFNLSKYVFDTYIKINYSNFEYNEFLNLVKYIGIINKYRDNSAHSLVSIKLDKHSADECKNYIMASERILEILSNLS